MYDWNDLKAFLAVARGGSTLAASKAMSVNQTTVARRIESLEGALGLKLIERLQSGSRLTEAGRDLMADAERVETAAGALAARAEAHQRGLAGVIRFTCIELMANVMLTNAVGEFRLRYPEVQVDMIASDKVLDIEAGEADVAVRTAAALPVSNLVARKLIEFTFHLYCSHDYAERRGLPASPSDLANHDLLGAEGDLERTPGIVWMFEQAAGKSAAIRFNTLTNMLQGAQAGMGIAALPTVLGDADPRLRRCSGVIQVATSAAWLVTRRELRDIPRVRAFIDFIASYVAQEARRREAANRARRAEIEAAG
jgi:DNA-binding transcriptional LysR family regulator